MFLITSQEPALPFLLLQLEIHELGPRTQADSISRPLTLGWGHTVHGVQVFTPCAVPCACAVSYLLYRRTGLLY